MFACCREATTRCEIVNSDLSMHGIGVRLVFGDISKSHVTIQGEMHRQYSTDSSGLTCPWIILDNWLNEFRRLLNEMLRHQIVVGDIIRRNADSCVRIHKTGEDPVALSATSYMFLHNAGYLLDLVARIHDTMVEQRLSCIHRHDDGSVPHAKRSDLTRGMVNDMALFFAIGTRVMRLARALAHMSLLEGARIIDEVHMRGDHHCCELCGACGSGTYYHNHKYCKRCGYHSLCDGRHDEDSCAVAGYAAGAEDAGDELGAADAEDDGDSDGSDYSSTSDSDEE